MSQHMMFRRQPVPPQAAVQAQVTTIAAPTRGIIQSENDAFMQPGAAVVLDNWMPTMQGIRLRGGCVKWSVLPERTPVISAFEYSSGTLHRMYAANQTKLYDVTFTAPTVVASGRTSGNYAASQLANAGGDWLLAVNDAGNSVLRFNGTTWANLTTTTPTAWANAVAYAVNARALDTADNTYWKCLSAHTSAAAGTTFTQDRNTRPTLWTRDVAADGTGWIQGPPGSSIANGGNLVYVCKYRNRLFFIELNSMNAWYLPLNAVSGQLLQIPLSGAATKGGHLLFCATWSLDAGDGIDDKLVFATNFGELLIFTGSDPGNAANWRQEGRYEVPPPMGMNAHILVGGDLLIATTTGIVPTSAAITKEAGQLELAAVTRNIKREWRDHVVNKREWAWTMKKWDEFGGIFVTVPGGAGKKRMCLAVNDATGAWARFVGYDATCFLRKGNDLFFGTQDGVIMQADRSGYDDGLPYTATMVGSWNALQTQPASTTWTQARAAFVTKSGEPFAPQLTACTDFIVKIPPPISAGPDTGIEDVWDEGHWDDAKWDQVSLKTAQVITTGWVSIGITGFSHAPIVQVTVGQNARPNVELISIDALYTRGGVNV